MRSGWSTGRVPLKAMPCLRQSGFEGLPCNVYWLPIGSLQPVRADHLCILDCATFDVYLAFLVLSVTTAY